MIKKIFRFSFVSLTALLIIAIGGTLAWVMYSSANKLPLRQYFPESQTNAVWDWTDPANRTQKELDDMSKYFYLHQLNTAYVYVDAFSNPNASEDEMKDANEATNRYIKTLQKRQVRVFVVGGDVTWSNRDQWQKPKHVVDSAIAFNKQYPDTPIAGVELDIESYNQEGFADSSDTAKSLVLLDWLDMVDALATQVETHNKAGGKLELGFAIPYWFDNQNSNIPSVTWHNKTGPTLYHLLDRLNKTPESNVVVMAYRNAARGNDGVVNHARTEVEYADGKAPNVKVLIGQELGDVEPAKITYYGQSTTELSTQAKAIANTFDETKTYGGVALNDLASLQEMQE